MTDAPRTAEPRRDDRPHPADVARAGSRQLVRRILCDNPGMMTGPGTNTYLVGIDEIVVDRPRARRPERTSTPSPAAAATASAGSSAPTPTPTTRRAPPG